LLDFFKKKPGEFCYDIVLNRASFTENQVAKIILDIMQKQDLI